jgi:hypothetical protein
VAGRGPPVEITVNLGRAHDAGAMAGTDGFVRGRKGHKVVAVGRRAPARRRSAIAGVHRWLLKGEGRMGRGKENSGREIYLRRGAVGGEASSGDSGPES